MIICRACVCLSFPPSRKMRWQKAEPKASTERVQAEQAFIHDSRQHGKSLDPRDVQGKTDSGGRNLRPCLQTSLPKVVPYRIQRIAIQSQSIPTPNSNSTRRSTCHTYYLSTLAAPAANPIPIPKIELKPPSARPNERAAMRWSAPVADWSLVATFSFPHSPGPRARLAPL